jgi:ABC-type sulfate/molybdate transport systems ATPase subunit
MQHNTCRLSGHKRSRPSTKALLWINKRANICWKSTTSKWSTTTSSRCLRGVSLNVSPGGIVALLGTNGAGKTTTLRAISGLLKPENGFIRDGYIKFGGSDITNVLGTQVVKLGAIMVPEGRRVFKHLTVEENIRVGSITRKDGSPENSQRQRQDVRSLPPAGQNYPPAGRVLLRRRATDDRHCPGPDGSAENAHAGRTLFRPGATAG